MLVLTPKLAAEDRKVTVSFSNEMTAGSTISSGAVTAVVYSGVDASPSSIISGSVTISGQGYTQLLIDGVEGCIYLLTFSATTSDSQIIRKQAYLAITPASGI